MARDFYINLDASTPASALVTSFTSTTIAPAPQFYRDETYITRFHFLRNNPNKQAIGRPFVYVPASAIASLKVAMGAIDDAPDGGTFTITDGAQTTAAIAYNASAATVQSAIRAALTTNYSAAVVTGDAGGPWTIDAGATGALATLTATATSLTPDGSTVVIVNTQNGSSTLNEKFQVRLVKAYPLVRASGWTTPNAVSVATSITLAGSATANKIFNVTWNSDAHDGAVWLSYTPKTGTAATVGPIPYDANEQTVIDAFEDHAGVAAGDILVTKNGVGNYDITCTGTNGLSNTPSLATSANTLQIPDYFQGTLSAATAGVDDLLAGATSVTAVFEVEIEETSNNPRTAAVRSDAKFYADLIRNTPGQSTANEVFPNQASVVNLSSVTTAYTGGASSALDAITTTDKSVGFYLKFVHSTDGPRAYQLTSGTTAESSPDVIRPDDYATTTNEKVWLSRE